MIDSNTIKIEKATPGLVGDRDFIQFDIFLNVLVCYCHDHVEYLIERNEQNSQVVHIPYTMIWPNAEKIKEAIEHRRGGIDWIMSLLPNRYERHYTPLDSMIGVAELEDSLPIGEDRSFIPIPVWHNAFIKITPLVTVLAILHGDNTTLISIPSEVAEPLLLTEEPSGELTCPNRGDRLRCCVNCHLSKGGETCPMRRFGLKCCLYGNEAKEAMRSCLESMDN